ncbi:YmaF family protein [compost metagenome]
MKSIPVKGYILQNEEKGGDHSHRVYITTWDGRPVVHTHPFSGVTSYDDGHDHKYAGVTEPAPSGVPHVHRYFSITSIDQGHTHVIQGITGPAIPVPGGHIHHFEGVTTISGIRPHSHDYKGVTGKES